MNEVNTQLVERLVTQKPGRNEPCPCGSGKKYKKCCAAGEILGNGIERKLDYISINKDIAYKGKLGLKRRAFCIEYIRNKKQKLHSVEQSQQSRTAASGKTISCQKGCYFCCSAYVEAGIQECEAIVYYLYSNDELMRSFLCNYPIWREKIKKGGDLFRNITPRWDADVKDIEPQKEQIMIQRFDEENKRYYRQDIACPFLSDGLCSIYEVRPYTCAALVSTSPQDRCRADSRDKADMLTVYRPEIFTDFSFYYGSFQTRILSFMPITVYEILKNGIFYLSRVVPGLENLDSEFRADPDVQSRLGNLSLTNQ